MAAHRQERDRFVSVPVTNDSGRVTATRPHEVEFRSRAQRLTGPPGRVLPFSPVRRLGRPFLRAVLPYARLTRRTVGKGTWPGQDGCRPMLAPVSATATGRFRAGLRHLFYSARCRLCPCSSPEEVVTDLAGWCPPPWLRAGPRASPAPPSCLDLFGAPSPRSAQEAKRAT
jgi:hypothetical protein